MDILRHSRAPGISIYEWCNSFSPLIRTFLRISQAQDLSNVELQRVNKCITAQITDFEQAVLAQANDKLKPITLADGAFFDLNELKRDISAADSSFRGGSTNPTLSFWNTSSPGRQRKASQRQHLSRTSRFRQRRSKHQMRRQSALQNVSSRAGHDLCITWIKTPGKTNITMDTKMRIGRKTRQWRMMSHLAGKH
jgi:hypothetical protein